MTLFPTYASPRVRAGLAAVGFGLAALPAHAQDSAQESAGDIATLTALLARPDAVRISLTADLVGTDRTSVEVNGDKVIDAGDFALPVLKLLGTGSLTIESGVYGQAAVDVVDQVGGGPDRTRPLIWVCEALSLHLVDLKLEVPPDHGGASSGAPLAVVDLHRDGAVLTMEKIRNTEDFPVTYALAMSTGAAPIATDVALRRSLLYLGNAAVLHGTVWDAPYRLVEGSSVEVSDSLFEMPAASSSTDAVGMDEFDGHALPQKIALVQSADHLDIHNVRFSGLRTHAHPLAKAPEVFIEEVMVDGLLDIGSGTSNPGSIALAYNTFVQSSLMCDIDGSGALFAALPAFDSASAPEASALSVIAVNSAFWQLNHSLFHLNLSESEWSGTDYGQRSALVASNVTLHLNDIAGANVPMPVASTTEAAPRLVLQNAYLQGHWTPGTASDRMELEHILMSDPTGASPCGAASGGTCTETGILHLPESVMALDCSAVIDNIQAPTLETTDDGRVYVARGISEVGAADVADPLARPALVPFTEVDGSGAVWKRPVDFGEWEGSEYCSADTPSPVIGAWSEQGHNCNLAVLIAMDNAASGQPQPHGDGLRSNDPYGLGLGCRYSAAGIWILLPVAWRRRRSREVAHKAS